MNSKNELFLKRYELMVSKFKEFKSVLLEKISNDNAIDKNEVIELLEHAALLRSMKISSGERLNI